MITGPQVLARAARESLNPIRGTPRKPLAAGLRPVVSVSSASGARPVKLCNRYHPARGPETYSCG